MQGKGAKEEVFKQDFASLSFPAIFVVSDFVLSGLNTSWRKHEPNNSSFMYRLVQL